MSTAILSRTAAALLACIATVSARGEIVDRILAVVEQTFLGSQATPGQIITWSGAYREARYQAFRQSQPLPEWSLSSSAGSPEVRQILDRMIDQLLLEQALEHSPFTLSGEGEAAATLREIESRFSDAAAFQEELARYQLSETALASHLRRESRIMAFVDLTLRPDIRVTEEQVAGYYEAVFVPALRSGESREGGAGSLQDVPPLLEVREQIQEILVQQTMNRRLEEWLQQLRRSADIRLLLP
jgi:hypothetical protein